MSSYQRDREDFIRRFVADAATVRPDIASNEAAYAARLLLRHSTTHGNLAVQECDGHPIQGQSPPSGMTPEDRIAWNQRVNKLQAAWDARIEKRSAQLEKRMLAILKPYGFDATFGGDPRGFTVKLKLPSGASNTWGGSEDGYGVPQRG